MIPKDELKLRLLYVGHEGAEIVVLTGALDSAEIPYLQKRDFGMQSQAPAVFFSPGTEVKVYVSDEDWEAAVDTAHTVLGDDWQEPTEQT
jgi:hypothetical protein